MGRFNVKTYDPQNDSSVGYFAQTSAGTPAVYIHRDDEVGAGLCHCGCKAETMSPKTLFRMGHDARFKGTLIRAHLAGVPVVVGVGEDGLLERTALEVAATYDKPGGFSWSDALRKAQTTAEATPDPQARPARPTTGPQVGDQRLIKVGRWDYTARITQVLGEQVELEYVTKSGELKTTRQLAKVNA